MHKAFLYPVCDSWRGSRVVLSLLAAALLGSIGCAGGGQSPPPPPGNVTVAVSPKRGSVTTSQTQQFTATVNGSSNMNVTWEVDTIPNGSAAAGTISANGLYTPSGSTTPGAHTITARSVADTTATASASFGVTDLLGVFTHHNDPQRTGQNRQEYSLKPSTLSSSIFGKLFSCPAPPLQLDAEAYAQPLYVANLTIPAGGSKHNVVFVATQNDSVYAFDGDASPCVQLWKASLLDAAHGAGAGATPGVPADTLETGDIPNKIGITGTPVIDSSTNTLYVVSKTKESDGYHQRLHALDLTNGNEKLGGPVEIQASVPGNGDGSVTGSVPFDALRENQRPALLLLNRKVYIAWASHGDRFPYHGWVIAYDATTLAQTSVFNATPNGGLGGIWQSGNGPAADSSGNLYVITGNGTFDDTTNTIPPAAPNNNFGSSFMRLSTSSGLTIQDFFTPFNFAFLNAQDFDVGSGGPVVLPDALGSVAHPHLLMGGDKQGNLYLIDRDNMGRFCTTCTDTTGNMNLVQTVNVASAGFIVSGIFGQPAVWENNLYVSAIGDFLKAFHIANGAIGTTIPVSPTSVTQDTYGIKGTAPGVTPAVSSSASTNGIVWAISADTNGTNGATNGPAVLRAYDATNLTTRLFSSPTSGAGAAGNAVKFTVPTVANGKVYIGTQTELSVFGLLPN